MRSALSPGILGSLAIFTAYGLALSATGTGHERVLRGTATKMGAGTVQSFLRVSPEGIPIAIGVALSAGALEQLPQEPNRVSRCFDVDGNGELTRHECIGDEERILDVPPGAPAELPFRWITVNWNPAGHPAPYGHPHFDFHFHTEERGLVEGITPGRCGELVDCGHFARATRPVPAQHLPGGYIDVGAVVPRMGNHLLDSQSPELRDSLPFTRTFIYGAYQGRLIFWEPMVTLAYLRTVQDACLEIRQPKAFKRPGYYPTEYCVRRQEDGQRTVSLEGFRYFGARQRVAHRH